VNQPNTTFDSDGVYTCDIIVSEADGKAFEKTLRETYETAYDRECQIKGKKLKKASSFPVTQDAEGDFVIKTKQPAKRTSKSGEVYEFTIKLFDAKGNMVDANVGGGSIVKCAVQPRCWFAPSMGFGMTLTLKAVQVLELVEFGGGGNASSFGFEDEDGFVSGGESLAETFDDVGGDF
jgi:hypothetical protein